MKKTLIALAVAASAAVSGSAMAGLGGFAAGNLNNKVDFGGTITPAVVENNWVWAVGQGYNQFSHTTRELSEGGTKLTITAAQAMPLLVGKTSKVMVGDVGISPQIAFSDSKGAITPEWADDNAEGTMTLTVNDAQKQEIGAMTLGVTAVAPVAWAKTDASTDVSVRYIHGKTGSSFEGAVGRFANSPSFSQVDNVSVANGAPSIAELQAQVKSFPGLEGIKDNTTDVAPETGAYYGDSNYAYSGIYALGVSKGRQLIVKFNKTISAETQWNAPLTMQVSYR
ncbi:hypothetical protein [Escherichia coli]|uniref:F4 family fimbrial subunit n=1 Tax=Escherichia coli TaxID=562 RepID=UPI000CFA8644|nr:hypothetical protein [Escherichia coli]